MRSNEPVTLNETEIENSSVGLTKLFLSSNAPLGEIPVSTAFVQKGINSQSQCCGPEHVTVAMAKKKNWRNLKAYISS